MINSLVSEKVKSIGNVLLLIMGLHCFEKKSLKYFAFSLQFRIHILLTRIGGILGALHLFITLLIIFQYDIWEVSVNHL